MNGERIVPGNPVTLHFALSLHDGTEAVSTFDDAPLSLVFRPNGLPTLELDTDGGTDRVQLVLGLPSLMVDLYAELEEVEVLLYRFQGDVTLTGGLDGARGTGDGRRASDGARLASPVGGSRNEEHL